MKHIIRIISASSLGTILEWYDFSLFAYLTPILAKRYFPEQNMLTALMLTYAIFAIGYFVRPLGAVLFGHLGDRIGRKKTLIASILLMTVCTVAIGLLPTYNTVGMIAPIALITLRLGQGLSAGGESTGAFLFALESFTTHYRGMYGAILWSMIALGMLLGSFAATMVTHYPQVEWLWRVPFLLGAVTGLFGYFLRKHMVEPPAFSLARATHLLVRYPLWHAVVHHKSIILRIMGLYTLSAMISYLIFVFMPSYAANLIGLPFAQAQTISTLAFFASILLLPFGGYCSDKWGRRNCLSLAAGAFLLFSYPLFQMIAQGTMPGFIFAQGIFLMMACLFQGTLTAAVVEMLPMSARYSVAAVGYNVSYSIFGGTAPLIATALVNWTGDKSAPGWYLAFGALLALVAALSMPRALESNAFAT